MLRALLFLIQLGLLTAAAVWVSNRPGTVDVHWLGYDIHAQMGVMLLAGLFALALCLFVYRLMWGVLRLPQALRRRTRETRRIKGRRALMLGLSAVAAGDGNAAGKQAQRARKFASLTGDDEGLVLLLEGQSARLRGDDAIARRRLEKLMGHRELGFVGLRGLLTACLEQGDLAQAARLVKEARRLHPKQPWVLRVAYDTALRQGNWQEAQGLLRLSVRHGVLEAQRARSDETVLLLQQAEDAERAEREGDALGLLRRAQKLDPAFVPAAARLAKHYLGHGKRRAAVPVIEKAWKENPHPELAALWRNAAPQNKATGDAGMLQWFERLVVLRPDSAESQIAAAEAALEGGLWGPARQYLERADAIRPSARIYRLRARLAQMQNRSDEAALMLRKASDAPPDKVWTCARTGRIYSDWAPVALPEGNFNTIIWGYPHAGNGEERIAADRTELLITAPSAARR